MDTTFILGGSGALIEVLAGLFGRLRGRPLGPFHRDPEEDLLREADGFVESLAGHVRDAEETVFPALRRLGSGPAEDIEELQEDHRFLTLHARHLATRIRIKDREGACERARSCLAVLLDHLRRESGGAYSAAKTRKVRTPSASTPGSKGFISPVESTCDRNGELKRIRLENA